MSSAPHDGSRSALPSCSHHEPLGIELQGRRSEAASIELSVVAPVYDEYDNLEILHAELIDALARAVGRFEIIWVDDRSTDGSFDELCRLAAADSVSRVVQLARHAGQSAAIWQGLQSARGALVATIDTDLQNDPADLPRLIEELRRRKVDLISGVRAQRNDTGLRRLASRIANGVRRAVLGDPFRDVGCSLKVYRREFVAGMPRFNGLHRFLPVLAVWNGARWAELEIRHRERRAGDSKYGAIRGRLGRGIFDLIAMLWLRRRWLGRSGALEVEPSRAEPAEAASTARADVESRSPEES